MSQSSIKFSCEVQKLINIDVVCHINGYGLTKYEAKEYFEQARGGNIENILVLWEISKEIAPSPIGFKDIIDFIKFIKKTYQKDFNILIKGYPESNNQSINTDFEKLKKVVAEGVDIILSEYVYDASYLSLFIFNCRLYGIACPIIPSLLPIQELTTFTHITQINKTLCPLVR
jgi:methylenetetrahydrofolate reductase (NADPH)